MVSHRTKSVLALAMLAATACATYPERDAVIEDARVVVYNARNNPQVVTYAPAELDQAVLTLREADDLAARGGAIVDVHRMAVLAQQRAALAQDVARTRSVEALQRSAREAQLQADVSRQNAAAAQVQAAAAQRQAEDAQRQAAAIQAQAQALAPAPAVAVAPAPGVAVAPGATVVSPIADLPAVTTSRGLIITLNDGMFDANGAQLRPAGVVAAQKLAAYLNAYPERGVAVEGYTDGSGNPYVDRQLSEDRARAVRAALIGMGCDPRRIVVRGYGPEYPIASNSTIEGRRMNRRVEVVIADRGVVVVPRG
jgi:outer membrane protein OmpA-like peptidoglycan-associated protein